ncbi:MAG: Plasmid pRiA4b ORF-3-like protein [Armatimonadetes bacterium]|nr:Plasmid pRiA4b ORF-3-like protein [Armatimonadota bacterium]
MRAPASLDTLVIRILRGAVAPLTADEILRQIPAESLQEFRNPRQKLRGILASPEVGHADRGRYVYLPHRITGSTFRLPLIGGEAGDGLFFFTAELGFALWFRRIDWGRVQIGATATWDLPPPPAGSAAGPTQGRFTVQEILRNRFGMFGGFPLVTGGPEFQDWLRSQRAVVGDSLLVRVTDGERSVCSLALERLGERDGEAVAVRNRELADIAAHILRDEVRGHPLFAQNLAGWLLARGFYDHPLPPDPLEVILLSDQRFTPAEDGKFALATRWEWVRQQSSDFSPLVESLLADEESADAGGEIRGPAADEALRRRWFGVDPLDELRPWLAAVGYEVVSLDAAPSPDEAAEAEARAARQREQVYRLRASLAHRRSLQRVLELKGDNTLFHLDGLLRRAFGHDTSDHMSGFRVQTGGGRRPEWLATINPFGGIEEGEDYTLAELDLEPGVAWDYVYDFGDWIEHTLTVEAVVPAAPRATYPRLVGTSGSAAKRKR